MSPKALGILGGALSAVFISGSVLAAGYNGNWPVTISNAQYYDGSYCLILSGSTSGGAELTGALGDLYGNFEVSGRNLIAIVPLPYGGGFNLGEVFILPAKNGKLGKGSYAEDGDGEIDNSGTAKAGKLGGC